MTDTFRALTAEGKEAAPAQTAQPIVIRKLDRLETTSPNSQGAS
jgi:hypothetical protein